jgi:hypothetical protein
MKRAFFAALCRLLEAFELSKRPALTGILYIFWPWPLNDMRMELQINHLQYSIHLPYSRFCALRPNQLEDSTWRSDMGLTLFKIRLSELWWSLSQVQAQER